MPGLRTRTRTAVCCIIGCLSVLSAPSLLLAAQLTGDTTPTLSGPGLIAALQKGGYIIYFRHGATSNFGEKDVADADLDNCAIQRNLSDEGQAQTRAIGVSSKKGISR